MYFQGINVSWDGKSSDLGCHTVSGSALPDGKYGYISSSFNPETDVVSVATHSIVARVKQASPFCPNIAATPDGSKVPFTLKDTGKAEVFDGKPPFTVLKVLETGPITNRVNIIHNANGTFAYVTVGGLLEMHTRFGKRGRQERSKNGQA